MKSIISIILLLLCPLWVSANSDPAGIWTYYPSAGIKVNRIFNTPNYIYLINHLQPYHKDDDEYKLPFSTIHRYDKNEEELHTLTLNSGLASHLPVAFEYNPEKKYLFVAYDDSNIDLLYDNGNIVNISGLKNADGINDKTINSVTFDHDANLIYVAGNFGYFTIDDTRGEVTDSYLYRIPLNSVARVGENIIAADGDGNLFITPAAGSHKTWNDFSPLPAPPSPVVQLLPLDGNLCGAIAQNRSEYQLLLIDPDTPEVRSLRKLYNLSNQFLADRHYFIGSSNRALILNPDGKFDMVTIPEPEINTPGPMASTDLSEFWFTDDANRFYRRKLTQTDGTASWSAPTLPIGAPGPLPFRASDILLHPEYGYIIPNHGINQNFMSQAHPYPLLLSIFKDGAWGHAGIPQRIPQQNEAFKNPNGIAVDPENPNILYLGSLLHGLIRYDLEHPQDILHFSREDAKWSDLPGFVKVHESNADWPALSQLSFPAIDNQGNLWFVYNDFKKNNKSIGEIWGWTAAQRKASKSVATAKPFFKFRFSDAHPTYWAKILPLETNNNHNIILFSDGSSDGTIYVINHNGTPDDSSDDRIQKINFAKALDTNGETISAHTAYNMMEDKETGLVWIATNNGVLQFSPTGALAGNPMLRQFKIARNDGTGLADYLLAETRVNQIFTDKRNRKWMATTGAGLVCVSPDGSEIITTCNTQNSDIPSDEVYAAAYNPETNSMMLATEAGLVEYQPYNVGDGTDFEYARAYPNPVRPGYLGYVTIDGLADNALVKIADAHGKMVRELGFAANGMVRWDLTDVQHRRVASGVYFVLASTGPDDNKLAKVTKILVVN